MRLPVFLFLAVCVIMQFVLRSASLLVNEATQESLHTVLLCVAFLCGGDFSDLMVEGLHGVSVFVCFVVFFVEEQ